MIYYLFKSFTSSFYGAELWSNGLQKLNALHRVSVAYHKAVKKTAGLNVWDSNHVACDMVGVPIFKHLQAKRMFKFIMSVVNSSSPCLSIHKYYFRFLSLISIDIKNFFRVKYDVLDFYENPMCALYARIDFVQRTEERSNYVIDVH